MCQEQDDLGPSAFLHGGLLQQPREERLAIKAQGRRRESAWTVINRERFGPL